MKVLIFLVIASCPKVIRGQILGLISTKLVYSIISLQSSVLEKVALKMCQYFYVVVLLHVIIFSPKCLLFIAQLIKKLMRGVRPPFFCIYRVTGIPDP